MDEFLEQCRDELLRLAKSGVLIAGVLESENVCG
jgi:hypothetical protein